MEVIESWINVVTTPLGLAGFALFLVFGLLAKMSHTKGKPWFPVAAVAMAFVALIGGIALSWVQIEDDQEKSTAATSTPATTQSIQITHGDNSPPVQNVEGDVTITITPKENSD